MTNKEKIKAWCEYDSSNMDMYELIVAGERDKMTEEKVREYLGGLSGKETALVVLNYLLRGGITDDDLKGLRLQWIKDEREKMQTEIGHLEYKIEGLQQALSRNKDEREKMQGVDLSKMSEILRSNSKETWIAAKGSDEGWNTWWKKRNQLNTN